MLDNQTSTTGPARHAKSRSTAKPTGATSSSATTLVRALLGLGGLSDAAVAAAWGRDRRGLIPLVLAPGGFDHLFPLVTLILREGRIVGVGIASGGAVQAIDYSDPGSIQRGRSFLQPSNQNLARRTRGSLEEALARALRYPDQNTWDRVATELGVTVNLKRSRVSYRAATRLASAIVNEAVHNCVGHARLGALAVALTFPPSLRPRIAHALDPAIDTNLLRDCYHQFPLLVLTPAATARWAAGRKLRDIAHAIGLPKEARRVKPGAVGVISYLVRLALIDDIDLSDLAWLTDDVCRSLPATSFRQKLCCGLALRVALHGTDDQAAAAAIWLANEGAALKRENDLPAEVLDKLAAYIVEDIAFTSAAVIGDWRDDMPLATATSNAEALREYVLATSALAKLGAFSRPAWASADVTRLSNSSWVLVRIKDGSMLDAEVRRFRNCAAIYSNACLAGRSVIFVARRRALASDRPSSVHHCPVIGGPAVSGAMLELQPRPDGGARMIQLAAVANREPPATLRNAIGRNFAAW
jgi:hypothetical protein